MTGTDRAALVAAARVSIAAGSHSFAAASRLFAPATRERAWLLYCWCRAADDLTDGQQAGHAATRAICDKKESHIALASLFSRDLRTKTGTHFLSSRSTAGDAPAAALVPADPLADHARLVALTTAALDGDGPLPLPFLALRQVARETALPRRWIFDHLEGFALDAAAWRPRDTDDLLRYCYHVAGSVGLMMAVIMGVDGGDRDTLDRACDLGLAFQLANIARDIVPDARAGRVYLPAAWLAEAEIASDDLALPAHRAQLAAWAARLVAMAHGYRCSARIGAARLPRRSRLAVLAADAIYGAIGERVVRRGAGAWDERVHIGSAGKLVLVVGAAVRSGFTPEPAPRCGLWTSPNGQI